MYMHTYTHGGDVPLPWCVSSDSERRAPWVIEQCLPRTCMHKAVHKANCLVDVYEWVTPTFDWLVWLSCLWATNYTQTPKCGPALLTCVASCNEKPSQRHRLRHTHSNRYWEPMSVADKIHKRKRQARKTAVKTVWYVNASTSVNSAHKWSTHTRYTLWLVLQRAWQREWLERGTGRERVSKKKKMRRQHAFLVRSGNSRETSFFLSWCAKTRRICREPYALVLLLSTRQHLFNPTACQPLPPCRPLHHTMLFVPAHSETDSEKCDNCTLMEFKDIPLYTHSASLQNTHAEDTCRVSTLQCCRAF